MSKNLNHTYSKYVCRESKKSMTSKSTLLSDDAAHTHSLSLLLHPSLWEWRDKTWCEASVCLNHALQQVQINKNDSVNLTTFIILLNKRISSFVLIVINWTSVNKNIEDNNTHWHNLQYQGHLVQVQHV